MESKKIFIAALAALAFNAGMAAAAPVYPLTGTKHDLSSTGTGTYRAASGDPAQGGTTEKCIFCHTPHSGNTEAPLWNRASYLETYQTYTSDVLAGLGGGSGYWPAEDPATGQPHSKTRICLSCHDGTIALGSVVNMPSNIPDTFTEIQMFGGVDKIQQSAPGYIGLNLRDDHPVAIKHDSGKDAELVPGVSVDLGKVRLYQASGGKAVVVYADQSYVECTSCHNPHNNEFGKFLIETNRNSALCLRCHTKEGFSSSVHADVAINVTYEPPTGGTAPNPTKHGPTVGDVKCMNCHFPHKAGVTAGDPTNPNPPSGKYLLSFQEEASCFNNTNRWRDPDPVTVCHGSSAPFSRRIENLVNGGKSRYHQVGESSWTGRHTATEARQYITGIGWSGASLWHVECADCHNPHTADSTLHTRGSNVVDSSSPLYGTGGVDAGIYPLWAINSTSNSYSAIEAAGVTNKAPTGVQYEYQICLKCHSDFAWGINPPTPTITNPLGYNLTNQAMEFGNNAASPSSHPVIFTNANNEGTYVAPWSATAIPQQKMYCSDCHNNDTARSPFGAGSDAAGPHGSNNRAILKKPYDPATIGSNSGELCFDCHDFDTYSTGAGAGTGFRTVGNVNLHTRHMAPVGSGGVAYQGGVAKVCTGCHVNPPHGINRQHLISYTTDQAPYGTNTKITAYTANTGNYVTTNCSAVTCHTGSHP